MAGTQDQEQFAQYIVKCYKCTICGLESNTKNNLNLHIQSAHHKYGMNVIFAMLPLLQNLVLRNTLIPSI